MRHVAGRVRAFVIVATAAACGLAAGVGASTPSTRQGLPPPPPPNAVGQMGQPVQAADAPKGTGLLLGQVVDASGHRPIAGVLVSITGGPVTPGGVANAPVAWSRRSA